MIKMSAGFLHNHIKPIRQFGANTHFGGRMTSLPNMEKKRERTGRMERTRLEGERSRRRERERWR